MPFIDLALCPLCLGTRTVATTSDQDGIAGKLAPCECVSGVEAITEQGEVLSVGKEKQGDS